MLSDEQIAALTSKHGRIEYVSYNGVDLVLRKPKRNECQQYMIKREAGGAEKVTADEQLAQLLIVRCGTEEDAKAKPAFLALLDEWPLLCNEASVAGALGRLAGVVQTDALKSAGSALKPSATPQASTQSG